ncbi:hypothetical protein [Pararhizobium sp. IMCC21322]|uniref:hypothetical protein n=1 Tax=Pararhizobium sp. IMCC21322 TaxID=3067903 RepID=UPI0027405BB6|nr:hypothetical protein [Pararhizobium sp. IMCC21322]
MTVNKFFAGTVMALVLVLSTMGFGSADTLLAKADGSWSGSGWFRNGIDTPKEAARCRYKNQVSSSGDKLTISGKCTAAGRTFKTTGTIDFSGSGGRFTGGWSNPRGPGTISLVGQQSGSKITFTFRAREETTSQYLAHRSIWTISSSKLRLVGSVKNPDTGKYSDLSVMEFSR